jgi:hypothetical protein
MAPWARLWLRGALALAAAGIALVPPDALAADTRRILVLSPGAADDPDTTHAALIVTRESYSGRIAFAGRVRTVKQLRTGSPPNPWECAWLVWNYQDEEHFYYVALKPAGWEVGKRDPSYPGGQRFLASGEDGFALGTWHEFRIVHEDAVVTVQLNGRVIASIADGERPIRSGRLGLYTEDAEVELDGVSAPFRDDFTAYRPVIGDTDGFVVGNWIVPFLGYGLVAIAERPK